MRLYRVILPVNDIEKAESFYKQLLALPGKRVSPGRHYFDCEGTILACFDPQADGDNRAASSNPEHIYFAANDLDAVFSRAVGLCCNETGIKNQPWGERMFYAQDPFGNRISFVEKETVFTGKEKTA